jgi:hypothetical protein
MAPRELTAFRIVTRGSGRPLGSAVGRLGAYNFCEPEARFSD